MRAVIERESHEWKVRSDAINDVAGDAFEDPKPEQRLRPKQKQPNHCEGTAHHQKHESVSHAKPGNYRLETSGRGGSPPEKALEKSVTCAIGEAVYQTSLRGHPFFGTRVKRYDAGEREADENAGPTQNPEQEPGAAEG